MGNITVFFKDGYVIGSCPTGQEKEWANGIKGHKEEYDRTKASTDDRWHAWARARCTQSESYAQSLL
jgi:hypothetical protein